MTGGREAALEARLDRIRRTLTRVLVRDEPTTTRVTRPAPRQVRMFSTPTVVSFDHDDANGRTVMELVAGDRPGLLSKVGQAFTECNVRLQSAKIATVGAEADDIFFVTTLDHLPLQDHRQLDCLADAIISRLDDEA